MEDPTFIEVYTAGASGYALVLLLLLWHFTYDNGWVYFLLISCIFTTMEVIMWEYSRGMKWGLRPLFSGTTGAMVLLHGIGLGINVGRYADAYYVWIFYVLVVMYVACGSWFGVKLSGFLLERRGE